MKHKFPLLNWEDSKDQINFIEEIQLFYIISQIVYPNLREKINEG